MKQMQLSFITLIAFVGLLAFPGLGHAADIATSALSENGWFSDDTRADGTGTQTAGTNLVSDTLTDDPEATASGSALHDPDITAQIVFGAAPGAVPFGTHPGAVNLTIAAGAGSGKSQISHRKDDGTGHAPGSVFGPGFLAEYHWMGDGTASVTASLKFGIKTSDFGSTGSSTRTGENAWDKVFIYEPGNLNGGLSDGTWYTETVDYTTGKWWFFDRTAGASIIGTPMTLSDMAGALGAATLVGGGPNTAQDIYNLITAPGAHITSVQFGIGSGNAGGNVYVNQLETNFYRPGDRSIFAELRVHNVTQATDHLTIQDAVDNALSGDFITVDAGTFVEQVVIDGKDLTIQGAGKALTTVEAPATLATIFTTSGPNKPVITAMNTSSVVLEDMTVDGLGLGNTNVRFFGVAWWNAGGALLDSDVVNIMNTPFSGSQHGIGVFAANDDGGPYALEIGGVDVLDYQKNAMALTGGGLTVDVHDCTTPGQGPTTVTAQNGIQISHGAGGSISDCTVSDMDWTPDTYVASGLIIIGSPGVDATNVTITDVQEPVYFQDVSGNLDGLEVTGGAEPYDAVFIYNSSASKPGPGGSFSAVPVRNVSPFDPGAPASAPGYGTMGASAVQTVSVSNSCFTGTPALDNDGIMAYSNGGPLTVSATNNKVTGYAIGLRTFGPALLSAQLNSVSGNTLAGYDNSLGGAAQDATLNWWGAADGPSGDGPGTGDAVLSVASEVDISTWLFSGASSDPCAFLPVSGNPVVPVPDLGCISSINPCINVDFDITRTDNAEMRGASVTFTLSPELELCSGLASITEGTYLDSISPTNFLVLDNGGGSYTVDVAILGLPCGQDAATGTLFSIGVKSSVAGGLGTITVDDADVTLRNCVNVGLPASGGVATLDIDNTNPAGITDLAAAQVKTGNDGDGTTEITLTFTGVEPGATVTVYRKGFGFYPEYDDDGGSVPATPATPAAALTALWTPTAVTASGQTDETDVERDFMYFVAFQTDSCGNVSPVSNMTDGTLNYHLGDVVPFLPLGDNVVDVLDISNLGIHYGTSEGDLLYLDTLDVGPTADYFVNTLPTTDNDIQFEDLMMFAINHGQVSKPGLIEPQAADRNELVADISETGDELTVTLNLASDGNMLGVSVPLAWNPSVVEPVGYGAGELLDRQMGQGVLLSPSPGTVDATVFGSTLRGEGVLGTLTFRVVGAGDPGIALGRVLARDTENAEIPLNGSVRETEVGATVTVTKLVGAARNPFLGSSSVGYSLAERSPVRLRVFGVDGRLVRTLVDRVEPEGQYEVVWDGRDVSGREVASGSYLIQFTTKSTSQTQRVVKLK